MKYIILFLLFLSSFVFSSSDDFDLQIQYNLFPQDQSDNSDNSDEYTAIFEDENIAVEEDFFQINEDELFSQTEIVIVGIFGGGGISQNQEPLEKKKPFEGLLSNEYESNTTGTFFQENTMDGNEENDFIAGIFGGGGLKTQQSFIENGTNISEENKAVYEYLSELRKNQEVYNHDFDSTRNTHYTDQYPYFPRMQSPQAVPLITGTFGGGGILQFSTVPSENDNNVLLNPNIGIFYRTEGQGKQEISYSNFEYLNFNAIPSYEEGSFREIVGTFGGGGFIPWYKKKMCFFV